MGKTITTNGETPSDLISEEQIKHHYDLRKDLQGNLAFMVKLIQDHLKYRAAQKEKGKPATAKPTSVSKITKPVSTTLNPAAAAAAAAAAAFSAKANASQPVPTSTVTALASTAKTIASTAAAAAAKTNSTVSSSSVATTVPPATYATAPISISPHLNQVPSGSTGLGPIGSGQPLQSLQTTTTTTAPTIASTNKPP